MLEGYDINISCTSTGGPIPTVSWTFNKQPINFEQSDIIKPATGTSARQSDGTFLNIVTHGNVMSTLHIKNAQCSTHTGLYTCTGRNSMEITAHTGSANIILQVLQKGMLLR